ncbi:MAG: hypothetical protein HXX09_14915, partial [Bacteroidetes bacterium]|nr:hypothetical protein [Bacteroidota bacterium]
MKLGYSDVFHKRELWSQLSEKFNGKFEIHLTSGNELEIHKLSIPFDKWELILSESDTRPIKFEIQFDSYIDYQLTIGREDTIDRLLKRLGKREIEIGNKDFDSGYTIESNDTETTIKLFSKEIIDSILKYKVYSISYSSDMKKQKSNLISVIGRTNGD